MKNCITVLTEQEQKYQHYHQVKQINKISYRSKKSDKQANFTYSPLGKALEKQTKAIEDQGKKQIKAIEDHGKQLVESNELIKKDFNVDRGCIPLEQQTKIFNELVDERSPKFWNLQKRINSDNLIYKCKTEGISPKDFSNYPNLIDLFKNLRDGNINSKKLLKNQVNFKNLKKNQIQVKQKKEIQI